ncbi:MAG TPA: glycosyltransferase [Vicinamibacterales bacterium]|nr:glycosyltransferase [Vicinamibacterales bacterium]
MTAPLVSIVLPTRNGMDTLPGVLAGISTQEFDGAVEIVAIDTASTDGTVDHLRPRVTRLLHVDAGAFNHGLTRNRAIEATCGQFVVLLSQDAEPANAHWLSRLVAPLRARALVAGSFARQVPRAGTGAIVRHYHAQWAGSSPQPRTASIASATAFQALRPLEQMRLCTFDNVCSCVRREVWTMHPFPRTPIAEDLEWAREVLLAGYEIDYVPDSVVVHSHDRSARYEFDRTVLLHQQLHRLFGIRTIPTLGSLTRATISTIALHRRLRTHAPAGSARETPGRALALAVAWPAGQYVGGRRGHRGLAPLETDAV